jgi:hypothetical protein
LNIGGIVVGGVLAVTFDTGDREGGETEEFVEEALAGCSVVDCKLSPDIVGGALYVAFDNGDREGGGTEAFVGEAFSGCSVVGCKLTPNICDVVG